MQTNRKDEVARIVRDLEEEVDFCVRANDSNGRGKKSAGHWSLESVA